MNNYFKEINGASDDEVSVLLENKNRIEAESFFLKQVLFSCEVWKIDPAVRNGCENVVDWIKRICGELMDAVNHATKH